MSVKVCAIDSRGIQRVVEKEADPARVKALSTAANAHVVRKRQTGEIVRINLASFGDDSAMPSRRGNPKKYYHRSETDDNPPRVLTLRKLPHHTASIFGAVVNDCMIFGAVVNYYMKKAA